MNTQVIQLIGCATIVYTVQCDYTILNEFIWLVRVFRPFKYPSFKSQMIIAPFRTTRMFCRSMLNWSFLRRCTQCHWYKMICLCRFQPGSCTNFAASHPYFSFLLLVPVPISIVSVSYRLSEFCSPVYTPLGRPLPKVSKA